MHIVVSGSTGFVGSALVPFLTDAGHRVTRLVRSQPQPGEAAIRWDPAASTMDAARLEGLDAVVHLAGESVIGRWTPEKKTAIRDSRVRGTRLLADTLAKLSKPPRAFVCASAIGYYGDRGNELLTERSAPGKGFLADVGRAWEEAATTAAGRGIRVVHVRIGTVLSATGGALAKMLPPFRLGLGGRLGSGHQYMSWIALDDLLGVVLHAVTIEDLRGPVNAVSPHPVTNREFTRALGRALGRPAFLPVPAFAVRLLFGEMGEELLLASARVEPARLLSTGYRFRYPQIHDALRHALGCDR